MKKFILFLILAVPLFAGAQKIRIQQLRSTGETENRIVVTDGTGSFVFADLDTAMVTGLTEFVENKTTETIDSVYIVGTVIYIEVKGKATIDTIDLAPLISTVSGVDSLSFSEGWFRLYQNGEAVPDSVLIDIAGSETDPDFNAHLASEITPGDTTRWGNSGTDNQTATEVPITDAGGYFDGTEVETALQELGADVASGGDNWGSQTVVSDASLTGTGVTGDALSVDDSQITITESQISDFGTYIEGNESITLSGEIAGTGSTSIPVTVADNIIDYNNVDLTLKSSATNNTLTWDISANGIIYCTPSTGTVSFTNSQVNKYLTVVLTLSSATITWPATAKILDGSATLEDGTFYVYIHCISSTIFTVSITKEAA